MKAMWMRVVLAAGLGLAAAWLTPLDRDQAAVVFAGACLVMALVPDRFFWRGGRS